MTWKFVGKHFNNDGSLKDASKTHVFTQGRKTSPFSLLKSIKDRAGKALTRDIDILIEFLEPKVGDTYYEIFDELMQDNNTVFIQKGPCSVWLDWLF